MSKKYIDSNKSSHHRREYLSTSIPSWLGTPPSSRVNPPVETKKQELPFGELGWRDFEKLCLRLVRLEADVEYCQSYGVPGQKQEGIDIYARKKLAEKYKVYQCKRVKDFGPSEIRKAVAKFLQGDWVSKTDTFVLCTKVSLSKAKRANELMVQSKLLKKKGIKLFSWDSYQLSMKLKDHPELVDDFFGREWVKEFCGEEQAKRLGKRLDLTRVAMFREKLGTLYKHVFNSIDPGLVLPTLSEVKSLPLEERYVFPDVNVQRPITVPCLPEDSQPEAIENRSTQRLSRSSAFESSRQSDKSQNESLMYWQRQSIKKWLTTAERFIILGGPGTGKSMLLHFIAIDLLKEEPRLALLSQKWGQFLPVWVPFALWTKIISKKSDYPCSLGELLHNWLKSWNEEDLWPLIEQALEDERLLLLVDGLDECTNEQSAGIALHQLKVFIEQHNIPAIVTSRPHGIERFGMQKTGWQIGELSGFSIAQQEHLSRIWFSHKTRSLYHGSVQEEHELNRKINAETENFITELHSSARFRELAEVPLLLCLLIYHRFHNVCLPQSRFKAYDTLIEHLISTHPQRRKEAAFVTDKTTKFTDEDIKGIFSCLAFRIQKGFGEGVIDFNEAIAILEDYLEDFEYGLGFGHREARQYSREILNVGKNTIGLLAEWSSREIGFFHRVFQEYLAAYYLSHIPLSEQLLAVEDYCADPQWHEVILGLFHLTNRTEDIRQFVDHIKATAGEVNVVERHIIDLLLCQIAFGDFNCPVDLVRDLAQEVFKQIELGSWMPHREHLLHCVLEGLRSAKARELVKSKLRIWFPCREKWREGIFKAMTKWPKTPDVIECLLKGIHDEEPDSQLAAADALAILAAGDSDIGNRVASLAYNAVDPMTRAAAIRALLQGWPDHRDMRKIVKVARKSASPELRLVAILGNIHLHIHDRDDWKELLRLGSFSVKMDYHWRNDVGLALVTGWPRSPDTKKISLKILREDKPNRDILERELALRILLEDYPQDQDVAQFCVDEISHNKYHFGLLDDDPWNLLRQNFKDNPQIAEAIDEWMTREYHFPHEIAVAALLGCTQKAKAKLLSLLDSYPHHWVAWALLEGWGMNDSEVAEKLKKIAFNSADKASQIGYLLPRIIEDKNECQRRLLELFKDPRCARPDFVIQGLEALGNMQNDSGVIDAILDYVHKHQDRKDLLYEQAITDFILGYSSDKRVKNLAKQELFRRNGNYTAVAWTYGKDEEIRQKIIEISCPLPANLRKIIAVDLGESGVEEEFALSLLGLYDHEQDGEVKTQASISYYTRLKASEQDSNSLVESLSKSIVCYGYNHEERRQAAFCGLVVLDRLDVMINARERHGDNRRCTISINSPLRPNFPLLRHILQNWDHIKAEFGEEFWFRFSRSRSPQLLLWDALCIFADEYPSPCDEALHFLETRKERKATSNIMRFIDRVRPKSSLLLEYCFKALCIGENCNCSGEQASVAAELLGKHFGGDSDILAHILSDPAKKLVLETEIFALCEGWPKSKELDRIFRLALEKKSRMSPAAYFQLICEKKSSDAVFAALTKELSDPKSYPQWQSQVIIRAVLRRLQKDDSLFTMLVERLQNNPNSSEKATIPRLIATARGMSSELKAWCITEAKLQMSDTKSPETGLDLTISELRPIIHCLLDLLSQER